MWDKMPVDRVDQVHLDIVDIASALSFPASDPPAWATGTAHSESAAEIALPDEDILISSQVMPRPGDGGGLDDVESQRDAPATGG